MVKCRRSKANRIVAKMEERGSWIVDTVSEEAQARGLLVAVGEEVDESYLAEIKKQLLNLPLARERGQNLCLVFTPLHTAPGPAGPAIVT